MAEATVSILEGNTFVVSDRLGDIDASPTEPHGLFNRDTRYLSRWRLTVDGRSPQLLSTDDVNYFSAQFFLVPPDGTVYSESAFSIVRKRAIGEGFHEDVTVMNHTPEPLELELRIEAAADFADLFEVKDALAKQGEHYRRVDGDQLVLGYKREGYLRESWITASAPEVEVSEDGFRFLLRIEPKGEWTTCLDVLVGVHAYGKATNGHRAHGDVAARPKMRFSLDEWLESAPALSTDSRALELSYERSLVDLAALRFYPPLMPDLALPAAGLPWFMTVFGRDSLITGYQALPYAPELAETTLRVLGARQGTRVDHFRDMEPGKILHEIRFGEMTAFAERPHSPYYGTADATPLFVVLLDEYVRWAGDPTLARELEIEARAALDWIDAYGDRDGDGYVEYERHLMSDRLFSGWGVRTMAVGDGGYNPIGYHNGTVWPHDNSLIAHGLARYGYREEAARIAFAMLEAAEFFRHRLPEAFAGYPREDTLFPVEYPTACSPQAWASGTPLLCLTTILGLEPDGDGVRTNPVLPAAIGRIELSGSSQRKPFEKPRSGRASVDVHIAPSNGSTHGIRAADIFDNIEILLDPARTRGDRASYRFDIVGVGVWAFAVDDGRIARRSVDEPADCSVRMSEATFLNINLGQDSPMTAFLRGEMAFEGDLLLVSKLDKYVRESTGDITDATESGSS